MTNKPKEIPVGLHYVFTVVCDKCGYHDTFVTHTYDEASTARAQEKFKEVGWVPELPSVEHRSYHAFCKDCVAKEKTDG